MSVDGDLSSEIVNREAAGKGSRRGAGGHVASAGAPHRFGQA